jgi:hypothetical protein
MAKAKENFGRIMEKQQQMMEKISANTNKMFGILAPHEMETKEGQELLNDFVKRSQQLMEEQFQSENMEKFWEKMPEQYHKTVEMQMEFFNRSTEYMRRIMEKYAVRNQTDYMKKMSEIAMDNYHAMVETSSANMKAMQEYFSN